MKKEKSILLPYFENTSILFERFLELPFPILLDSCSKEREINQRDIFSAQPKLVFTASANNYQILDCHGLILDSGENVQIKLFELENHKAGNIMGYVGYHSLDHEHKISSEKKRILPDICLGVYVWRVEVDHDIRQSQLIYMEDEFEDTTFIDFIVSQCSKDITNNYHLDKYKCDLSRSDSNLSKSEYLSAFNKIKEYIEDGDCYQVNLAQRFTADFVGNSWAHYICLKNESPAPYCSYMQTPFGDILSFSPESFIKIDSMGEIISQPIKGTRKRNKDVELDNNAKDELYNSQKDKAENLMIVDLIRNDLSKSAELNSVKVDELFRIESFSNVHHMVSQVKAKKRHDVNYLHVLFNAFPGGSITGAPKHRAMEIINELEPDAREVYCGAIGYLMNDNSMAFNIAIRTLVIHEDKVYCWGGGGIVADSDGNEEYQESINKISNLVLIN